MKIKKLIQAVRTSDIDSTEKHTIIEILTDLAADKGENVD